MSNYLQKIENEYSRGRGRASMLSPLDWNLAQSWEDSGIPLHIVINTMAEGFKNFKSNKHCETINSLRYFEQKVNKTYAEWQTSQVGKTQEKTDMPQEFVALAVSDETDILDYFIEKLTGRTELPEPLLSTVNVIRGELIQLLEDAESKQLSSDAIEARLGEMETTLNIPITVSVTDEKRKEFIAKINADYNDRFQSNNEAINKLLMRELYNHFDLPKLTLFEI